MSMKTETLNTNITIIGGGNIGTHFAIVMANKGYNVTIFSSKYNDYADTLVMLGDDNSAVASVNNFKVTSDIAEACEIADYIFVTHPAFMFKETALSMYGHTKKDVKIGLVPGTGGGEFFFSKFINDGATLFGLQRVPAVARLIEYGHIVAVHGKRECLHIGCIPQKNAQDIADFLSYAFDMPCKILPNYLSVTLTPSNPILHTTRLKTLFGNYVNGKIYAKNPLFYEEWSIESAELLIACDQELQRICQALGELDLSNVRSLKLHYESNTAEALTNKLQSIKSLQGLYSPMKEVAGGYIPDFSSRYFTADFPFGLSIIKQFADIVGVEVPNITETLNWFYDVTGSKERFNLSEFGINKIEDIYKFYRQ